MANRATNGSISDSRTSTDGHRTPNTDNLSKTNLYIRGLATNTTDEVLYNLCAPFGNITSTRAIMDKLTGNCKGYGFVQFRDSRSAEVAVQELAKTGVQAQMARISPSYASQNQHHAHHNQHHFHHQNVHQNNQNNGNQHNVANNHNNGPHNTRNHNSNNNGNHSNNQNNSFQSTNSDPDPTNLYLANLPLNMSEQELENLLSEYGPVVSTRILRDIDNRSKGVGFARMESRDKCQEIIKNLNGKSYKGAGEALLVKFADGGVKRRHQYNNHHHNNHHHSHNHHHHHQQSRWRDTGLVESNNINNFDQQGNIIHGNQMTDLSLMGTMGYQHRLQAPYHHQAVPLGAYHAPMAPTAGAPQWMHPAGPEHAWGLIPQQMIPTSGLNPSNQAAVAAAFPFGHISQLATQMQGLQISHHPSGPIPDGFIPSWTNVWPHGAGPPRAPNLSHQIRLATPHPPSQVQQHQPHQDQSVKGNPLVKQAPPTTVNASSPLNRTNDNDQPSAVGETKNPIPAPP